MMSEANPAMIMAGEYLESTNTIVFLTGKAGTGKTTFLQKLRQTSTKNLAVVAPTGVAAINAGGMTIHAFFQLPFSPLLPGGAERPDAHYNQEKKELLANLELLIIDEISMVRPDVLDRIDLILRNIKDSAYPFGGVQLLLIGDLSQLSPIIRDDEWVMLRSFYTTPYFFSSQVLRKAPYVRIELDQVYRQKEQVFVDILNEVRDQSISPPSLALLNARHVPGFRPPADDPYITLTTHNSIAQEINTEFITALEGQTYEFKATIRGDFPKDAYPTETELVLKKGAQVMFVKNDASAEKLFYNGKIGTVSRIEGDTVFVTCAGEKEIAVEALEWTNIKYQLDGEAISETNAGSFIQYPLKLAWAITIHKSQGLSFEKAIIDVSASFAHGQAYVALSRCRSLSGMVLRNPISAHNIICDPAVNRFNEATRSQQPNIQSLKEARESYRIFLLGELFNFQPLNTKLEGFAAVIPNFQKGIVDVAEKFTRQLKDERVSQAAVYFSGQLRAAIEILYTQLPAVIDRSKEKAARADQLIIWLLDRLRMMDQFATHPFTTETYLNLRKDKIRYHERSYLQALNAKPNQKLFDQLIEWREKTAGEDQIMPNMVLSENTIAGIAEKLPATLKLLSAIKGVGPQKAMKYGEAIIALIRAYQQNGPGASQPSLF